MEARELRIGNLVIDTIDEQIKTIDCGKLKVCFDENDVYEPIPLTEDWLLKLGFEKFPDLNEIEYIMDFNFSEKVQIYLIYRYRDGEIIKTQLSINNDKDDYENDWCDIPVNAMFVHQIQNLFHSLTGEELKII